MARMPIPARTGRAPTLRYGSRGVTLLELIVTMSVTTVLLALAIPSFNAMQRRNQVDTALHLLTSHFASARIAAITQNVPVVVCPGSGGETCRQDSDWTQHWLTFRDPDGNRQPDEAIDVYRNDVAPRNPRLRILSTSGRGQVRYLPTGYSSGSNLTLRVCYDGKVSGVVVINNAGRIRSARPNDAEPCPAPR